MAGRPTRFKIEVMADNGLWHDVRGADGNVLVFDDEAVARAKLAELYPVLVQMERYAGGKRDWPARAPR
jgi:hypothetical protein